MKGEVGIEPNVRFKLSKMYGFDVMKRVWLSLKDSDDPLSNSVCGLKRKAELSPAKQLIRVVKSSENDALPSPKVEDLTLKMKKCEIDPVSTISNSFAMINPFENHPPSKIMKIGQNYEKLAAKRGNGPSSQP